MKQPFDDNQNFTCEPEDFFDFDKDHVDTNEVKSGCPQCEKGRTELLCAIQQEGKTEMVFRFICLDCRHQFDRTMKPKVGHCEGCHESYFYFPLTQ